MIRLPGRTRRLTLLAVGLLVLTHYGLTLAGLWRKSLTFDEIAHITTGVVYWRFDDYRFHPENGNLPQRLAGLPLALSPGVTFPDRDQPAWRSSNVWIVGDQFFHAVGNDVGALLRGSRAVMALTGAALCIVVFLWSRSIFGLAGGFISLIACAFSPLVLAHGGLATSDMSLTLFLALTTWSAWSCLRCVTMRSFLGFAAATTGLTLSKTSAVLFLPVALLLAGVALASRRRLPVRVGRISATMRTIRARLGVTAGVLLASGLMAWGGIWVAYGGRFEPYPPGKEAEFAGYLGPGTPAPTLESIAAMSGLPGPALLFAGRRRLLPEPFLYGTGRVLSSLHRPAFLNGEYFSGGWRSFFPYCFLVKSTLPMLLLCVAAAAAALVARRGSQRWKRRLFATTPLWTLLAVLWVSLIFSTMNIGARHMLPVYPPTFVLLGVLGRPAVRRRLGWLCAALLVWHAGEAIRGFPHYLAYFNQITGRTHAYRHLVESSLDWGQDLPGLKAWLDRRLAAGPPAPVYLSYFGTGSPAYYGIAAEPLELEDRALAGLAPRGRAGIYCVSATNLQGVYAAVRGRWSEQREAEYRLLASGAGPPHLEQRLFELGTARLMAYLRGREPDVLIGFSILVHELSEDDLRLAFEGPPPGDGS